MKSCIVTLGRVAHAKSRHLRGGGRRIRSSKSALAAGPIAQTRRKGWLTPSDGTDKDRLLTGRLLKRVDKSQSQHHGESGLHSRPSSCCLESGKYGNLSCEKPRLCSRESWQTKPYGAVKCFLETPRCTLPESVANRSPFHCCCLCVETATLVLEARFNNSKYFKTAVESTVTSSPKIVSCGKK